MKDACWHSHNRQAFCYTFGLSLRSDLSEFPTGCRFVEFTFFIDVLFHKKIDAYVRSHVYMIVRQSCLSQLRFA